MTEFSNGCSGEVDRILASDMPDLEKVAQAFGCITGFIARHAEAEMALAKALQDSEELIKTQIKQDTIRHARSIFEFLYRRVAGRRPWHEPA